VPTIKNRVSDARTGDDDTLAPMPDGTCDVPAFPNTSGAPSYDASSGGWLSIRSMGWKIIYAICSSPAGETYAAATTERGAVP
jgi:hypothetical protein